MRSLLDLKLFVVAALCFTSCSSSGYFKNGVYHGKEASYRLDAPSEGWTPIRVSDNDLAWEGRRGEVIAVNATCRDHGDPSLQVLTNHLLMGFEDKELYERETLRLAGRAALRSHLSASIDGVARELELLVLKRDGCVYDMIYIAPSSSFAESLPIFRSMVDGFEALGRAR